MNNYTVYKHTCPNGKVYIGITGVKPEIRWANGKGYHHNAYFTSAIRKYGWGNIDHSIIAVGLSEEEAYKREIELIKLYKSNDRRYGYNQSTGGEKSSLGRKMTKEQYDANLKTIEKMRVVNTGRKVSEETRKKLSLSRIGIKLNKETKAKIPHDGMLGKHHSKEAKERIRTSNLNKKGKRIVCVETNKVYASIKEAERETGIPNSNISACAKHKKHYNTAGGFHWEYVGC